MAEERIGTRLGAYRIERLIGRGGMGMVFLAEHEHLGRKVALKILPPDLAADESFRKRFVRESRTAAGIEHPNVIPVYDAGEADGELYIAMKYVEGTDLRALLNQRAPLEPAETMRILEQVGAALDSAHREGLVHRDVKPGNILIAPGGHVYLSDFGLTKRTAADSSVTATGFFVGTMSYAPPEQIQGHDLDGRADQYSLACVAFECLTGRVPFARETDVALIYAHLQDPPPRASELRPDLPSAVDDVLVKGMAKARDDRYPASTAMVAALRQALEGTAVDEAPTQAVGPPLGSTVQAPAKRAATPAGPTPAPTVPPVERTAPAPPSRPQPRRRAWPLVALGAVLLGGLAAFLLLGPLAPSRQSTESPSPDGETTSPDPQETTGLQGRIAFLRPGAGEQLDVWVMNTDGSGRQMISSNVASGTTPSWSPDRRHVALDGLGDGDAEIYRLTMEKGGRLKQLTRNESEDMTPSWSPDASTIAYASNADGDFDIWVMDADGGNQRKLFEAPGDQIRPSWSPDGSMLVYEDRGSGNGDIYVVDASGDGSRAILADPSDDTAPEWSPRGSSIAFRSNRDGNLEIYTMNADGSNLQQLTNTAAMERAPTWSPDGNRILFHSDRDGDMDIWIMDADGGNQDKLTKTTGDEFGATL